MIDNRKFYRNLWDYILNEESEKQKIIDGRNMKFQLEQYFEKYWKNNNPVKQSQSEHKSFDEILKILVDFVNGADEVSKQDKYSFNKNDELLKSKIENKDEDLLNLSKVDSIANSQNQIEKQLDLIKKFDYLMSEKCRARGNTTLLKNGVRTLTDGFIIFGRQDLANNFNKRHNTNCGISINSDTDFYKVVHSMKPFAFDHTAILELMTNATALINKISDRDIYGETESFGDNKIDTKDLMNEAVMTLEEEIEELEQNNIVLKNENARLKAEISLLKITHGRNPNVHDGYVFSPLVLLGK